MIRVPTRHGTPLSHTEDTTLARGIPLLSLVRVEDSFNSSSPLALAGQISGPDCLRGDLGTKQRDTIPLYCLVFLDLPLPRRRSFTNPADADSLRECLRHLLVPRAAKRVCRIAPFASSPPAAPHNRQALLDGSFSIILRVST